MASFYLDHNVAHDVAAFLRAGGHDVRTSRDIHTESARDNEHLTLAYQNGWIFVTHNIKDFELLHDAWIQWSTLWGVSVRHAGILALDPGPNWRRIVAEIEQHVASGLPFDGEMHVWRPRLGWQQRL